MVGTNKFIKQKYLKMVHLFKSISKMEKREFEEKFVNKVICADCLGEECDKFVEEVEKTNVKNVPVYNFEVEQDNSYCVENTIVHNCQPFSIAGHQEGFKDERSNVFWKILEIVKVHRPDCVILENVKNLKTHDSQDHWP